jgi:hypothetical protein
VKAVNPFSGFALFGRQGQRVGHVDPFDNQHVALFLNFAARF